MNIYIHVFIKVEPMIKNILSFDSGQVKVKCGSKAQVVVFEFLMKFFYVSNRHFDVFFFLRRVFIIELDIMVNTGYRHWHCFYNFISCLFCIIRIFISANPNQRCVRVQEGSRLQGAWTVDGPREPREPLLVHKNRYWSAWTVTGPREPLLVHVNRYWSSWTVSYPR